VNIGGKIDLGLRFLGLRFPLVNSYFKYHANQTGSTVGGDQDQDESNKTCMSHLQSEVYYYSVIRNVILIAYIH
jgi:hypothetical protein